MAVLALSLTAVLAGMTAIAFSGASANYKQRRPVTQVPATITVNANLAAGLAIKEHAATRQDSGVYSLGGDETTGNRYILMPGVDIPKDPFVLVTGKTAIPAYLYVEVVDGTGMSGTFTYSLTSDWNELNVNGKHGGTVYVYRNGTPISDSNTEGGTLNVPILEGNKITISNSFDVTSQLESTNALSFYAYMAQAVDTPDNIYNTQLAS
ncbi:MAG: hypothetical protein IJM51_06315 [Clostridia bacterium]|nr:hypothetical protein [Clostridia bacterium]